MSRPSPLAISVGSVRRLLKEETTYRTELTNQEARLRQWESSGDGEDDDEIGNREWAMKQEVSRNRFARKYLLYSSGGIWVFLLSTYLRISVCARAELDSPRKKKRLLTTARAETSHPGNQSHLRASKRETSERCGWIGRLTG